MAAWQDLRRKGFNKHRESFLSNFEKKYYQSKKR